MILTVNSAGKLVIQDLTEGAKAYIEAERQKLHDPVYQHWFFSQVYGDTVYITTAPEEDKFYFVQHLDALSIMGMGTTETTKHLLFAWRREAAHTVENMRSNAEIERLTAKARNLKIRLRQGCDGCKYFASYMDGDDACGECKAHGDARNIDGIPAWTKFENKGGVSYPTYKFYPREDCIFLKETV